MTIKLDRTIIAVLIFVTSTLTPPERILFGAEEKSPPKWEQLNLQEQRTLKIFANQWEDLPNEKRQKLRRGARLWLQMKEPEKATARTRFEQWEQLGPAQQQDIRNGFQRFQHLPSNESRSLLSSRHWFMNQSEPKRQQLKDQWDQLPVGEREEFLDQLKERWREDRIETESKQIRDN